MSQIVVPPKLNIAMIVATDTDRAIGKENKIPWDHKADMKFFRETTTGHMVLMGRTTWVSLGAKPLPKRHNLVLSNKLNREFFVDHPPIYPSENMTSVQLVNDIQDAIDRAEATRAVVQMHSGRNPKLFVIGGQSVYEAFLPYTQVIYHNVIATRIEAPDKYFPEIGQDEWITKQQTEHERDEITDSLPWREQVFVRRLSFPDTADRDFVNVWTGDKAV